MDTTRFRRVLSLASPIVAGMISANVLSLVDTAMVGTLGDSALAAVGISTFASMMCFALVMGVSTGVQAIAARRKGQGRDSEMAVSLNAGILFALIVSPPLTSILYLLIPRVFPYFNGDPEVIAQGVPYLRIRVLAILLVGLKFAFRGYWNGVDLSRLYMWTLLVMHASNILLNYLLIFGKLGLPALGVVGAGIGTVASNALGVVIYFFLGWKYARASGFLNRLPSRAQLSEVARLAIPSGVQYFMVSAGVTAFYMVLGRLGTAEVAAAAVIVNLSLVVILPAMGLGVASTTLVSQALGRGDRSDAALWGWDVVKVTLVLMVVLAVPICLFPQYMLSIFIHDPETLELARWPMVMAALGLPLEGIGMVLSQSLLGAGDVRRVLVVGVTTQWVIFLPLAALIGPVLGLGILAIWIMGAFVRVLQVVVYSTLWRGGRWARVYNIEAAHRDRNAVRLHSKRLPPRSARGSSAASPP